MNTDNDGEQREEDGCEKPQTDGPGCDPKLIDDVQCRMMGIAKEAEYNAPLKDALEKAKTDYELTRKSYRQARQDVQMKVQDLRHAVKQLTERVRCKIEQERVVRNIDRAFGQVVAELAKCQPDPGCCCSAEDCDFDLDITGIPYDELVKRVDKYQQRTDAASKCFTDLVGEPAALQLRVAACKDDVDKVNAALLADEATTDLKMLYAQALVAERGIERVWLGFADVHEFVECLCCALTCWTNGCGAVSRLKGAQAERDCRRKAVDDHCLRLQTNTVDEIVAIYDKHCADERPCEKDKDRHERHEEHEERREEHEEREEPEERERHERREGHEHHGEPDWYERHGGRGR
ncbi:hypothetical protein IV500_00495 [Paeniglutamicibacter antarcticus]|uniref:Uncharacterized protein n=1 Tax=Arthrobacter terrae TaxID=2935737 RepID=A0A931CN62_9MICC|nr:hypothetical protein [Arthrobacter terrae]MBG0737919.1 hypothetical protein [Arthrobacter terrae]